MRFRLSLSATWGTIPPFEPEYFVRCCDAQDRAEHLINGGQPMTWFREDAASPRYTSQMGVKATVDEVE